MCRAEEVFGKDTRDAETIGSIFFLAHRICHYTCRRIYAIIAVKHKFTTGKLRREGEKHAGFIEYAEKIAKWITGNDQQKGVYDLECRAG